MKNSSHSSMRFHRVPLSVPLSIPIYRGLLCVVISLAIAGSTLIFARHESAASPSLAAAAEIRLPQQQNIGVAVPNRRIVYSYEVINTYPHDPGAFTQGLVYQNGLLYESTGLYGSSSLRKVALETGQVLTKVDVSGQYFAEGLAIFNDRAIQLTWQHNTALVYQLLNFQPIQTFSYPGEGWGLTHDGQSLIMSDGTNQIRFLDPQTFQLRRTITVKDGQNDVRQLNELEYIDGEIYANIWLTDRIVRISPTSGKVNSIIDLTGLLPAAERASADVLNGIAWDAAQKRLFVTGKLWPKLFEIRLTSRRSTLQR